MAYSPFELSCSVLTLTVKTDKMDTSDVLIKAEKHSRLVSLCDTIGDTKVIHAARKRLWIVSFHLVTGFGDGAKRWT
jgi:hypothetical protein